MKKRSLFVITTVVFVSGAFSVHGADGSTSNRVINVDYTAEKGPLNTMFNECIGAGRANEGLRADWQQQLAYVKQECGFKYIRMHGLLTDDMAVYSVNRDGPQYNFMYVDALFDYLLSIDMKPFVELGFMPSALSSGKQTIFWWRGNVTPPNDYDRWGELIQHLVEHWTERYGEEEVKSWYFEVWNEPNLSPGFWTGTQEDYFKLYAYAAKAVKSVNPAYRVGGPATAGAAWEPEMIAYCVENEMPLDFISTHTYGVKQGFLDEYGQSGTVLSEDPMAVSGDVLNSRREISESAMPDLELHYTEWSSSYTPADPIHDSYHEAPYILQKIKQVDGAANSMSYWVFTDIFEEAGPRFTPFHGGFGLLNIQGINKPAFYAYQFMNRLGETELKNDDPQSWACKSKDGSIQVLVWDYTYTLEEGVNNQNYYVRDLPAKLKGQLDVKIKNIPKGSYVVEVYQIGYRCNDAYSGYLSLGKPAQLTQEQVERFKRINAGTPIVVNNIEETSFSMTMALHENNVYLFLLKRR